MKSLRVKKDRDDCATGFWDQCIDVEQPKRSDILCGKDRSCCSWEGSVRFREIIDDYRERYCSDSTSKQEKMEITREIVAKVSKKSMRFLKYDSNRKVWRTISKLAARDKVSHALRFAHLKEHRKTGTAEPLRRRVSVSSASGKNSSKTPSPEDAELWNSLLSRQTKLLESIKKGAKADDIPACLKLPKSPESLKLQVLPEVPDLDPLSIDDSSFEENPTFQEYCSQLYRSDGHSRESEETIVSRNETVEDFYDDFSNCPRGDYFVPPVSPEVTYDCNFRSEKCIYEDYSDDGLFSLDDTGDDISCMIAEPLMAWDLENDAIFEV